MSDYRLEKVVYLSEGSTDSDNLGQIPLKAKYKKTFLNTITGELSYTTDLLSKVSKRNKFINQFCEVYSKSFKNKKISILSLVVYTERYKSISKFINTITRKLKRKNIERLGYVWIRDVGDERFEKHYHIIISTSRIDSTMFHTLFNKKTHNDFKVEFMRDEEGMANYIKEKDLFGEKNQRSYGKSRLFPLKKSKTNI